MKKYRIVPYHMKVWQLTYSDGYYDKHWWLFKIDNPPSCEIVKQKLISIGLEEEKANWFANELKHSHLVDADEVVELIERELE